MSSHQLPHDNQDATDCPLGESSLMAGDDDDARLAPKNISAFSNPFAEPAKATTWTFPDLEKGLYGDKSTTLSVIWSSF